jgi:hypothetical protein
MDFICINRVFQLHVAVNDRKTRDGCEIEESTFCLTRRQFRFLVRGENNCDVVRTFQYKWNTYNIIDRNWTRGFQVLAVVYKQIHAIWERLAPFLSPSWNNLQAYRAMACQVAHTGNAYIYLLICMVTFNCGLFKLSLISNEILICFCCSNHLHFAIFLGDLFAVIIVLFRAK